MMFVLLAAITLSANNAPSASRGPVCSLRQLSACGNTNQLIWDKPFQRQLKLFAGKARTNALGLGYAPLSEDLLDTLGGPPDEPIKLSDGNLLFTACVAHNCTEKGAIVLRPDGSIVAAAMLTNHFVHEASPKWTRPHDGYSRLDFYVRAPMTGKSAWHAAIVDWATAAYDGDRTVFDKYWSSLGLTETFWLIQPNSAKLRKIASRKIVAPPAK
jgi:hypothetical protein